MDRELRVLDVMNSSGMLMTLMTLCGELRALDAMNNSKLWMI